MLLLPSLLENAALQPYRYLSHSGVVQMPHNHVSELVMVSIMKLVTENDTLSWSKHPENDTQSSGTSLQRTKYKCLPPGRKSNLN